MPDKTFRILSLDGGGIRGIITAVWLHHLEMELAAVAPGTRLRDHFDLIAGTSTGSILACAIALGIPSERIIDLYKERGGRIFHRPKSDLVNKLRVFVRSVAGLPLYNASGLEEELQREFKKTRRFDFGSAKVLVTAYDTLNRKPLIFKSWKAEFQDLRVWEVCRASSAAPVYFPAHEMRIGEAWLPLIDGGVVANNPSVCAVAEALRLKTGDQAGKPAVLKNFILASFGTGSSTKPITMKQVASRGPIGWLFPLIDVLFDASLDAVDYAAGQLISDENYFRFQMDLPPEFDDMDDPDATHLNNLAGVAEGYLGSGVKKEMDRLIEKLASY